MRFGQLITPRNKKNCKDNIKLNALKLSQSNKEELKYRIKIEHVFAHIKAYKRINIRYDNYVLLAVIDYFY